jgi:AcrR family transcriptional regulator
MELSFAGRDMTASAPRPTATTVSRLLDAVESLCAEMSPSDVTMRKIATEAGLSLGVPYRYFASRNELFGAALDRMGERIVAAAIGDEPLAAIPALWTAIDDNPAFPRLVTSFVMSGGYAPDVMSEDPLIRTLMSAAAELDIDDPGTVAGVTGILALSGAMFGPTLNRAIQRDPDDQRVYDALSEMLTRWLSDLEGRGTSS